MNFKTISSILTKSAFLLGSLIILSQTSFAEESKHTLSEFSLGAHISGPEVDLKDVKGKVVVIDIWGANCGPCLAQLPHVARLHRRYADKGLVVVATECQNNPVEKVNKIVKKNRLKCCVTKRLIGPSLATGIPYMAIFNTSGELVWHGKPGRDADRMIKKELRNVGDLPEKSDGNDSSSNSKLINMRTWTNSEGKTMEASLRSIEGENGVFITRKGRKIHLPLKELSQKDQDLIASAQEN